jgi:signal transduction histidine kinase
VFDWQQITRILTAASADSSAAELIDHDGRVLASTADWSEVAETMTQLFAISGTSGFHRSPDFGWQVVLAQPEAIAFAPVHRMGWVFLLLLGLTAILAILAAAPVAARIARPLALLTGFARNFMREQHAAAPPDTGPAEVRELSAAFAQMIADLERSRENLTRAAKLAVVGEMAAAMTHEVRTPLGILRSSAQLLLREPDLSTEGREVCGFIISETERLNRLVSTLLDCARPRAPEFKPVDIGALARQTTAMLAAQARKKNIEIDCAQAAEGTVVECDEEQITQVLLNLLLNALQILPENRHIAVATWLDGEDAVLEVADDGPGIPAALRERVFDPFFTQRAGGVGLGLVIVRQIVAAHGGEIGVFESKSGGALFHVRLPVHRKEGETA